GRAPPHTAAAAPPPRGRLRSSPVRADDPLLAVCRYVERNALRAGLVKRAEDWPWGSLWRRTSGPAEARALLSPWPVPCPEGWLAFVNEPQSEAKPAAQSQGARRGQPYGEPAWVRATAARLRLGQTLRPRGRPRKRPGAAPSAPDGLLF